jgi:hypothetical protein
MFLTLSMLLRPLGSIPQRRHLACLLVAGSITIALPVAAQAADMKDVHQAIDQGHLFDAFLDLLPLAKQGNPEAQFELAGFYHWGRVGAADFTKARDWYQRSANQGNTDAMIGLAIMNAAGSGGPVDKRTAAKWLITADSLHKLQPSVAEWRDQLVDTLTPEETAAVTAEAKAFKPKLEN